MTGVLKSTVTELTTGKMILLVSLFLLMVLVLFVVPLWLQNRYIELSEKEIRFSNEVIELKTEIIRLELSNNKLTSFENLADFARDHGLDYNIVPVKLMSVGGN
ncbi:MAG TPA: hypothetical protein PLT31_01845 [Fibrobacteraceae bacterium]|jgi:cell division protein FtsL|nr:hypothetical protein [Fibrobacter sp.]HOG68444.1 hypothetical protein [Fibrobacteraceae bacterium]HPW93907.1 hypothetical protein [Fibrobacteraceae bacterium]HQB64989.1 hypothetical protein [Fibrobacteraceae bacterium]